MAGIFHSPHFFLGGDFHKPHINPSQLWIAFPRLPHFPPTRATRAPSPRCPKHLGKWWRFNLRRHQRRRRPKAWSVGETKIGESFVLKKKIKAVYSEYYVRFDQKKHSPKRTTGRHSSCGQVGVWAPKRANSSSSVQCFPANLDVYPQWWPWGIVRPQNFNGSHQNLPLNKRTRIRYCIQFKICNIICSASSTLDLQYGVIWGICSHICSPFDSRHQSDFVISTSAFEDWRGK